MVSDYLALGKYRLALGNLLAGAAGFALGAPLPLNYGRFAALILGLYLIIMSAAVFNNYFDRALDAKMVRTRNRALPAGRITPRAALGYGAVLLTVGSALLYLFTTPLALAAALAGFGVYVFAYTPLKPRTPHALWVGAVAGALPPVAGYAAATNTLDVWALALFVFMFVWQLPHFLAVAVYSAEEYSAAGVPLFMKGPHSLETKRVAKKIFRLSLVVLLAACLAIPAARLLL